MDEDGNPLTDDPEILALLDFAPVVRKCKRHDGWTADNQRRYIVGLAETGNPEQAAHPLGRTMSGAYKLRSADGGEGFAEAWDKALALHLRRNPRPLKGRPSRGEVLAGTGRRAWPARAARVDAGITPEQEEAAALELFGEILKKYLLKLEAERRCRLDGRIVAADFYVRQLTWLEVALDVGGHAQALFERLKCGDVHVINVVATPMSVLLDTLRRGFWLEKGEADRPPAPTLGEHDDGLSTGVPTSYNSVRDGDYEEWRRRQEKARAAAAEAQAAWEEKAAKDAEAWAAREAGEAGAGDASETEAQP